MALVAVCTTYQSSHSSSPYLSPTPPNKVGWNFPVSDESEKKDDFERQEMSFARPQMQMPKLRVGISLQTVTYKSMSCHIAKVLKCCALVTVVACCPIVRFQRVLPNVKFRNFRIPVCESDTFALATVASLFTLSYLYRALSSDASTFCPHHPSLRFRHCTRVRVCTSETRNPSSLSCRIRSQRRPCQSRRAVPK